MELLEEEKKQVESEFGIPMPTPEFHGQIWGTIPTPTPEVNHGIGISAPCPIPAPVTFSISAPTPVETPPAPVPIPVPQPTSAAQILGGNLPVAPIPPPEVFQDIGKIPHYPQFENVGSPIGNKILFTPPSF